MRWNVSLLAAEGLLVGATGWSSCNPLAFSPPCEACASFRRPRASRHQAERKKQQQQQQQQHQHRRVEFKGFRRRRVLQTTMAAAAGDRGGGDCGDRPSKYYNKDAWQRRASRAMKYVSMPIVKMAGQPREQIMIAMPFPAANATVHFTFDTLRRTTLITPTAKDALGVLEGPGIGGQPDFGACVELPAARIGHEHGDHYLLVMDAVVANSEQANVVKVLGPNTGGVLGLDFLNRYDLDLNFETNEARFYVAGAVDQGLVDTSLLEGLKCGSLPGGKLAIKMELNGGGPFTGVLDLASSTTVGNWLAARDLDVTSMASGQSSSYPQETGRPLPLMCAQFDTIQLGHVLLASVVDAKTAREGRLAVYVGHLPVFDSIARDISIREPRSRQLALVGQDLIGHTRIVLSCRSKRLYFAPLEANDIWAGQVV
ncbi:unnamed protein product [Ectocarpus sp. CCAP 1310/34]|nr:unnamed protein product [Ectocarpus sp. CCAP 1310/34]